MTNYFENAIAHSNRYSITSTILPPTPTPKLLPVFFTSILAHISSFSSIKNNLLNGFIALIHAIQLHFLVNVSNSEDDLCKLSDPFIFYLCDLCSQWHKGNSSSLIVSSITIRKIHRIDGRHLEYITVDSKTMQFCYICLGFRMLSNISPWSTEESDHGS